MEDHPQSLVAYKTTPVIMLRVGNIEKSTDAVSGASPRKAKEEIVNWVRYRPARKDFKRVEAAIPRIHSENQFVLPLVHEKIALYQATGIEIIDNLSQEFNSGSKSLYTDQSFHKTSEFCEGMTMAYLEYNQDEGNIYRTTGHQDFVKLQYLFNL